jgi:hypothetical protein
MLHRACAGDSTSGCFRCLSGTTSRYFFTHSRPACLAWRPDNPDLMRLSTALLVSVLLHLGLALWAWQQPGGRAAPGPAAASASPYVARLLPPDTGTPPRPAVEARARATPPAVPPATAAPPGPAQARRTPRPLGPINLDLPEARLPTIQGSLVLKLWIDEQGRVVAFEAEPTDLPQEYVTAVGEALSEVRFAPALREGRPAPGTYRIEIQAGPAQAPAR